MRLASYGELSSSRFISHLYGIGLQYVTARGKIRARHMLHKLIDSNIGVIYVRYDGVYGLGYIVRRYVCGKSYSDS